MIKSVVFIAFIAALGGFLFGYDTGVISGAILFIRQDFVLNDTQVEIVVSAVLIGAVIGASLSGTFSDKLGRRKLLLWTAVIFTFASVFTALSVVFPMILIGRICVGIAIGISSMISPLYIAEIAPAKNRGALVALNQFAITMGILISYLIDLALAESGSWRWMMGIAGIPSLILFISMLFLPDSPRWLISHGWNSQALAILKNLRGDEIAQKEFVDIQIHLEKIKGGWKGPLTPWLKRALWIGIGLAIFQQLTGINTVIYYAPQIFQFAGFKSASASIFATVCIGIINVLATAVALWLLDRFGRRPLLLIGLFGMILGLGFLSLSFHLSTIQLGKLTLLSLGVYVAAFAIGIGPVFWVLISEIYPLKIRGQAMGLATIANWSANLIVALSFLSLIQKFGNSNTFALYTLIGIASWLFSFFLVPETKGYTLEEIQRKELHKK